MLFIALSVIRVRAHATIDTTTGAYTGFESKAAGKHFDEVILERRHKRRLSWKKKR